MCWSIRPGHAGGPINIFQSQVFAAHAHAQCVVQDKLAQFSPIVFNQANRVTDLRKGAGSNYGVRAFFFCRRTMSDMVIHSYIRVCEHAIQWKCVDNVKVY